MEVTGIEVTQGVQTASNSVPLIAGKRTFVRVYVKSDDPTRDVPGITARLRATWTGGSLGGVGDWIIPTSVASITVKRSPQRTNLNDGFLFELPFDWLNGDNLSIIVQLNPNDDPEQSDGYVNNVRVGWPLPSESIPPPGAAHLGILLQPEWNPVGPRL